jgi:hypothetical protein
MKLLEKNPKTEKLPRTRTITVAEAGVEKSGQRPEGIADVDIFTPGLRLHRAEFGVGGCAEERKQAADQPCQVDELG